MDKITLISQYIESQYDEDLYALDNEIVFWVDWKGDDAEIVKCCENCIKTGDLDAELIQDNNELLLSIHFNGDNFLKKITDRDSTLILLNQIIQPHFDLRFCLDSDGNDTLAFLPLSLKEWNLLEDKFGQFVIDELFESVQLDSQIFNGDWDDELEG